jgi:hypothetical protein
MRKKDSWMTVPRVEPYRPTNTGLVPMRNVATNSMAGATYLGAGAGAASRYLAARLIDGRLSLIIPNASMDGPPHIQHCPREPREVQRTSGPWFPPTNQPHEPTMARIVPMKIRRWDCFSPTNASQERSKARLRQTEHPNALPTSPREIGAVARAIREVPKACYLTGRVPGPG